MSLRDLLAAARAFPALAHLATRKHDEFFYQRVAAPAVHVRQEYLVEKARGRRVLHYGFLDVPFSEEKLRSGGLLHSKLKQSAAFLFGVDVDADSLERYRKATGDTDNAVLDAEDATADARLAMKFDVILFPEILEHLRNPGIALDRLHGVAESNPGAEVCITVPNALGMKWWLPALTGKELVHPAHCSYFSPSTLRRLVEGSGFRNVDISFYWEGDRVGERVPGIAHEGVIATCTA